MLNFIKVIVLALLCKENEKVKLKRRQIFFSLIALAIFSIFIYPWVEDKLFGEPWTTWNKYSPFYGMNHRNTYGLPLSSFDVKSFRKINEDWKVYFPKTISAISHYKQRNSVKSESFFTHSFVVKVPPKFFSFGEELEATVTSLDSEGRAKLFGGDYYRARLIRRDGDYPDGIPCKVVDNEDGTYSVKAPLVLQGAFLLEVKLVISVEGIAEIIAQSDNLDSWGHQYFGQFETGEIMPCNVDLSKFDDLKGLSICDYSNPRNQEPWFCVRPSSQTCSKITFIAYSGLGRGSTIDFDEICRKHLCNLKTSQIVVVLRSANPLPQIPHLSSCENQSSQSYSYIDDTITGYFQNGLWKSRTCANEFREFSNLQTCLENKVVYFIGDSTIRQFFYLIASKANLKVDGPDNSVIWQQPKIARGYGRNYNTRLYYRAHGPPLQNPGPPNTRPYISDSIIGIPVGGPNVYVVFNIGAHLVNYHPSIFIHRLKGIKRAIFSHQKKFPQTKFLIRSMNVVEWKFEWNIYRFEVILRSVFRNMKNMIYLNFWDMGIVWPLNGYHPPSITLDQQALLMFSYVCA